MRAGVLLLASSMVLAAGVHVGAADDDDRDPIEVGNEVDASGPPVLVRETAAPSIASVLSAAYSAAGLDHDPARGWIRRARVAGLVPWVTVRTGRDTTWHDNDPVIGHGTAIEVRATWRLDRLVFDGRELQVASIEAARRRERRRLANQVIRAYFGWRRAVGQAASRPGWIDRVEEAAAELDALTDGWFTEELAAPPHTASEPRTPPATPGKLARKGIDPANF